MFTATLLRLVSPPRHLPMMPWFWPILGITCGHLVSVSASFPKLISQYNLCNVIFQQKCHTLISCNTLLNLVRTTWNAPTTTDCIKKWVYCILPAVYMHMITAAAFLFVYQYTCTSHLPKPTYRTESCSLYYSRVVCSEACMIDSWNVALSCRMMSHAE